jgi:hypothetical protein
MKMQIEESLKTPLRAYSPYTDRQLWAYIKISFKSDRHCPVIPAAPRRIFAATVPPKFGVLEGSGFALHLSV